MKRLEQKLREREEAGNLRRLSVEKGLIDFFSNDYMGLARSEELSENIFRGFEKYKGNLNGSTGSRLLSGNSSYAIHLEEKLADIFKAEKSLIFNSGYNANLSILGSVPQKGDTIIYDELIHASLKEGARLSFAKHFSFRHNDLSDLESKIQKAEGEIYLVVESVYSMDGDFCPLEQVIALADRYNAHVILDEAHSTGLWGENGSGLACAKNIQDKIFARIYTFGKGMGVHGACIAGKEILIDYLMNFARPFIYTTALPLHSLLSIEAAFNYLGKHEDLPKILFGKINLFKSCLLKGKDLFVESESPIQVLKIKGNENAKRIAAALNEKGFDLRPILSPTVKKGEERLRICLHVFNSEEEIKNLAKEIIHHSIPEVQ